MIKLSKEAREDMISSIKNYFEKERDEELGDLAAGLILLVSVEVGKAISNRLHAHD